ncbi:tetratricopeptide repeat domain-containing protein [Mytilinidion resinicola]|uniref:Tetratricopeptide repeat domain-containing protein n=1 Tax=Mytilinidion resinicola TaxID=574789 RepID=A0A6A6Y6F0_9PEZI|nr:tetratricopeptide repeat domain-containing protein [Mytilinidion resinicola]KAF2804401.1 tetratricopeptide repeat domain-containing protein [Mytilinidion resinicola]
MVCSEGLDVAGVLEKIGIDLTGFWHTTRRPIIFVAHSLGGIIVKSALIHSDAARKGALEEHRSIKASTYGIVFMGTPHQGGSGVQLGKLLVNVASVFVAADDRLMKHLERDSEWLQQQLGQYGQISGEFVTKFAYEEYMTPTVLGHSIMVVPRASAVVPGAADGEPIVIHANHIDMVKFPSKEDSGYKTVSGHLQIMAQSASDVIPLRWEEESRVNAARMNAEESFSLDFSLSDVSETDRFVARQDELAEMHKTLDDDMRRTVVLHGLGGIGKTQLAVAYAKLHRADYSAIFWLNIKDEDSLKQSFARVARRILREHPSASRLDAVTEDSKLDEVVDALAGNTDHAAIDIRRFLPEAYHGSIIITTRSAQVSVGHRIRLGKLKDVHDSLQILSNASRREGVLDDPDAEQLVKELDGLPLALATAGAYLDQVPTSFMDYLRLYKASWLKLQQTSPELSSYEDRALYSTWQLSFDHIKQQNELSAKLLQLWAYFDNQDIWFELLREGALNGPEWLSQLTEDELSFNQTARLLCDHGLAEVDKSLKEIGLESRGYSMHSCVHSWTVHVLNQEWDSRTASLALQCVGSHVRDNNASHVTQRRLIRHAAKCWSSVVNHVVGEDGIEWALYSFGYLYADQGKLIEAEEMYQRALQGYEKAWGPDHTSTLDTVNNLGSLYVDQGKLIEAEEMYQRALRGYEKALGHDQVKGAAARSRFLARLALAASAPS